MNVSRQRMFRPFKFGERDRAELIVQDSEVAMRAINDSSGNIIFLGRAIEGTLDSQEKWQIRKCEWDSNDSILSVTWPQNDEGNASKNYEFFWNQQADLTITGISQANPAVVTVSSLGNLADGDKVIINDVVGMTEVNFDGSNIYTVANSGGTTFELSGIDSTSFTAYSSAGTVNYGDVVNYTYS